MSAPALPTSAHAALPSQPVGGVTTERRPLEIPMPAFRREQVVTDVLDGLARERQRSVARARSVIAENGLSIEVARLRERLGRAAVSDLHRLLLATPGVVERLFLQAVKEALSDEQRAEKALRDSVRDDSVDALGTTLAAALDRLGTVLEKLAPDEQQVDLDGPQKPASTTAVQS